MAKISSYEVIWSKTALNDLESFIDFIALDSLLNAEALFLKIKKQAGNLRHVPTRGRVVPELKEWGIASYRELIISPWRLIYQISGREVFVVAVIDSRRNVEDILLDRLLD